MLLYATVCYCMLLYGGCLVAACYLLVPVVALACAVLGLWAPGL